MLKNAGAVVLACGLGLAATPSMALQAYVSKIDKNADGSSTYHVVVATDAGETLNPGSDFVTVYNFAGMVGGSAKAPAGWSASSEEFGKTPMLHGYPMVNPTDIPALTNVTWTPTRPVAGGAKVEGFSVTTSVGATTEGEYSAAVTRNGGGKPSKQAVIGTIETPAFWPH
jgi:hypothetical protein